MSASPNLIPLHSLPQIKPELATLVDQPPTGDDWLYEIKYDGYRILAYIANNHVELRTRNNNNLAERFFSLADALLAWSDGTSMIVDGEVAMIDDTGATNFQALQNYLQNPCGPQPLYFMFDLLYFDGEDLRNRPLLARKQQLETLLQHAPTPLHYSSHVKGHGAESLNVSCKLHLEGIMGKRATSLYREGRTRDWIKLKCTQRQEFVIGGFTRSEKRNREISSLLLGVYQHGELVYVGRVGTGINQTSARDLARLFANMTRTTSPFVRPLRDRPKEQVIWVEPCLVAEVQFREWTEDNLLRHPSFKGLRTDKHPHEVDREASHANGTLQPLAKAPTQTTTQTPAKTSHTSLRKESSMSSNAIVIDGVTVTNPQKVLFPQDNVTKEQVVRYYAQASPHVLTYAGNRLLSIVRCPGGVESSCFFKRHPGPSNAGIVTMDVTSDEGKPETYFYIDQARGFVEEAQMDTLEFHLWGSCVDQLEHPNLMVFDLDPDEGLSLHQVRQGVHDLKTILDELDLTSFLKTSGGKGYHVLVPFKPTSSWEAFRDFARCVAEVMQQRWPDRYTTNMRKVHRKGKIFVDWLRNGRGATSIAPYSIRAREHARVSMPIAWDKLDRIAPDDVDMDEAIKRMNCENPWKGFFDVEQALK